MKIDGPGHTLHFHGPGEEAWAESLKLFPLSIFNEEVSATTEALREALVRRTAGYHRLGSTRLLRAL